MLPIKSKELGAVLPWKTRNNKPQKVIIAWLPHVPTSSRNDMVMSCHFHLHWSDWWSLVSHRRRIGFRRMLLGIPQASEQASRFVASGASSRRGRPVSPRSDSADLTLAMEKAEGWEGTVTFLQCYEKLAASTWGKLLYMLFYVVFKCFPCSFTSSFIKWCFL